MKKNILIRLQLVLLCLAATAICSAQAPMVKASHKTWDVIYDYGHMSPAAVLWTLQSSDFVGVQNTKPKYFKQDRLLPKPRRKNEDFSFSGYQRGHLCPCGDRDAKKSWYNDTFYCSNVVLMTGTTNAGAWKETEVSCRSMCANGHILKIVAGPLWYQTTAANITNSSTSAADAMFKIVRCTIHPNEVCAWIVPNDNTPRHENELRCSEENVLDLLAEPLKTYISVWIKR